MQALQDAIKHLQTAKVLEEPCPKTADPTEAGKWCFDCGGIHLPQRSDGTATGQASAEKLPDEPDQELEAVEPQTEVQSPENAGGEMDTLAQATLLLFE